MNLGVKEGLPNQIVTPDTMSEYTIHSCYVCGDALAPNVTHFKFAEENRTINTVHRDKLMESMLSDGFHDWEPVISNEEGIIIDGQHRLSAAVKAGVIPVVLVKQGLTKENIVRANTLSLNWLMVDYVNYYVKCGYHSYVLLKQLMEKHKCAVASCAAALRANTIYQTSGGLRTLKVGNFKCTDEDYNRADRMLKDILPILGSLKSPRAERAIVALIKFGELTDFKKYKELHRKLETYADRVYMCSKVTGYLEMFVKIYNIRLPEHKKLKIYYM